MVLNIFKGLNWVGFLFFLSTNMRPDSKFDFKSRGQYILAN
jgi:hypothetical protein